MVVPLMISNKDDDLVGVTRRSDPLGLLAVWSRPAPVDWSSSNVSALAVSRPSWVAGGA